MNKAVTFLLTNPNHHWDTLKPIISDFIDKEYAITVISFCEVRRMKTPEELILMDLKLIKFFSFSNVGLKPISGSHSLGDKFSLKRTLLRKAMWYVLLFPKVVGVLRKSDCVIACNDSSPPNRFVFEYISKRKNKTTSFLLQEGIRFKQNGDKTPIYGTMGSNYILAWGKDSASHFKEYISSKTKVVISGAPRYDKILEKFRNLDQNKNINLKIGLFTNPIDDIRFCSTKEKLKLISSFIEKAYPIIKEKKIKFLFKCHPRESIQDYINELNALNIDLDFMEFVDDNTSIFNVFSKVDKSIMLASTVGLESLIFNKPLAVIKIYDNDYGHDFVQKNAAIGLDLTSNNFDKNLTSFIEKKSLYKSEEKYLENNMANLGNAVPRTIDIITDKLK